ncbi:CRTAC1 family protein, partial [Singulisphaera rosea]
SATRFLLGFGIAALDADNDTRLDLLSANGHVSDYRPAFPWKMRVQLLKGNLDGRFVDVSDRAGAPLQTLHLGRGLAQGDLDNDGRIDAIALSQNDPLIYLHNKTEGAGHSLTLLLQGTRSNRDAIGARLTLRAGGRRQVAQRIGGGSYQSASDPRIHFGLDDATRVDRLEVRWPSGQVDTYQSLAADRGYLLKEGDAVPKPLHEWRK